MATAADDRFSATDGLNSGRVTLERKKPTGEKSRVRFGCRTIGGGIDEDWGRTNFASAVVNPGTSRKIAPTLLQAKRQTTGKRRQVKARRSTSLRWPYSSSLRVALLARNNGQSRTKSVSRRSTGSRRKMLSRTWRFRPRRPNVRKVPNMQFWNPRGRLAVKRSPTFRIWREYRSR
jgi:hypothetical protein